MPATDAPPPPESRQVLSDFDLADLRGKPDGPGLTVIRPRCAQGNPGEIVVCARDPEQNRLHPLPATNEGLPPARFSLDGGVKVDIHVDSATVGGAPSNRVMIGAKLEF
ncbi:hypothetical protein SAMN05518801_101226 [Novosphingobium sp. CF614]|uniref:hypothetical protein n=1 Tax=Novosphingobium sp. CF614 TaxID=1884364 RepID=UPI0008EAF11F|nr:hypothetical protein [Novosphingobium sp. CF614]SFF75050.1 hypothetical protein SAMN05518801_101226 [Novosphingobium sp. CF614]